MPHMFVPGPVDVDPKVLEAQTRPMIPHRSKEFEASFREAEEKSRLLFETKARVFLSTSSGSGLQEAAMRNLVKEKVLVCSNGAFADRWFDTAVANGKSADKLEFAWGEPVLPERVAEAIRGKGYEAVAVVHNETSTGLENPIKAIAAAVREASPDTLVCVDAVSSAGGVKIEMDAWGIDMVLTSSQKCLALPPGLALGAVSDRAMERAASVPNRGWYFDFLRLEKHRLKDSTPATPVMPLIFALNLQLDRMLAEGLDNRFARHEQMAKRIQNWAEERGMKMFSQAGYLSKTVSTIISPEGLEVSDLNKFLQERGMRIASGYGALKGKTFRIAHMGETTLADVEKLIAAMDEYLVKVG